ncbi:MAG: alpha/beta fold hydrolase [Gemmatimonadetes bacterium]|nr:alpha/beta fold hydrolase [Gemmatimonadota bacterium]
MVTSVIMAIAFLGVPGSATAQSAAARSAADAIPRDSITGRLADLRRIHTPEGIEVLEPIEVNGSTQWLSIRGLNRANPILLVLHGGPGSPVMGASWAYQKPWEDFFTVVNWDRRGVGKSFSAADSARLGPTMTLEQLVDDAAAVVEHLLARLGHEKLFVLGYSYGTRIGPRLVERHPERFHAYVGLGQTAGPDAEHQLYATLMERVRAANDTTAIRELEALRPYPPAAGPGAVEKLLAARRWAREYDGGWYGKPTFDLYFALPEWGRSTRRPTWRTCGRPWRGPNASSSTGPRSPGRPGSWSALRCRSSSSTDGSICTRPIGAPETTSTASRRPASGS